jgi:hypothetical protein
MAGGLTESQVVKIWQELIPGRTDLVTEEHGPVRIVYPGRPNDDRGADIRDAVIATGEGMRQGDIEIHVNSSSWQGHQHHQDPFYNRVILHVVYRHDAATDAVLQNGLKVPTLALEKYIGDQAGGYTGSDSAVAPRPMPCRDTVANRDTDFPGGILDTAGDRRFAARAADFRAALPGAGAAQSLYQGIMGALGYTRNKNTMVELAQRMPLDRLLALSSREKAEDAYLARSQALLMGMAGLLPSQRVGYRRGDNGAGVWVDWLERSWAAFEEAATMSAGDWRIFKIRPGNIPVRRIAAMSYLLLRYRDDGLPAGLIHEIEKISLEDAKNGLEKSLLVGAEGYWGSHLDFGLPGSGVVPALLGMNRAGVIIVNVLLPFTAVACPELAQKAVEIYRSYPALAENTLERHMSRQLVVSRHSVNTARRQQGLIHIYKTYCSQGKCGECPLGNS